MSKESETTRNGDEKHVGIYESYFDTYNKEKTIYGKEIFEDIDVKVIKVYNIVFIISQDKLT